MRIDRGPHIGEYGAKTNAICDFSQIPTGSNGTRHAPAAAMYAAAGPSLLAVVFQHLIAGLGQLGTVLLQAGQNGEVALIDDRTAEALNVARTGRLLFRRAAALLLLGDGAGRNRYRQERECKEKF